MATQTLETAMPEQTILGCPSSTYHSLESVCSVTAAPPCATSTSNSYDAACCSSLSSYAVSLSGCFVAHAPTCLDPAAYSYLSDIITPTAGNPCAQVTGPMTSAAATLSSASSVASSASSAAIAAGSSSISATAATSSSATISIASTSATAKSDAQRVGATLKVYIVAALIGGLAVFAM